MLYLHEHDIRSLGLSWTDTICTIESAIKSLIGHDYCQPIKPYVRFGDKRNRIIAMPAYVGGGHAIAGIKWIASFPANLAKGLKRAHSVTVLNDVQTGKPVCIINTSLISGIRTTSLSGYVLLEFLRYRTDLQHLNIGIIGFGVIGKLHLEMIASLIGDRVNKVYIYDLAEIDKKDIPFAMADKILTCGTWKEVYTMADILITATVTDTPYISGPPKSGSLLLNISLRDFEPEIMQYVNRMIVDNWVEVCRENTDIERMYNKYGLQRSDTYELEDFNNKYPFENLQTSDVMMFNPMGMAVFDVALGGLYYREAVKAGAGTELPDE